MDPAGLPALLDAIRHMHGVETTWVEEVEVNETHEGAPVWSGTVQVFDLIGHPKAQRAFTWSHLVGDGPRRRFVAVLQFGAVVDAVSAVRASIMAG